MWDLIVSVPDHCLAFYFSLLAITVWGYLMNNSERHFALTILKGTFVYFM